MVFINTFSTSFIHQASAYQLNDNKGNESFISFYYIFIQSTINTGVILPFFQGDFLSHGIID